MEDNKKYSMPMGGISLCNMMFIAFLVLKLCHVIDWSWWWITAPLWIPFTLGVMAFVLYVVVLAFAYSRR